MDGYGLGRWAAERPFALALIGALRAVGAVVLSIFNK
jgi:hypothetical protein